MIRRRSLLIVFCASLLSAAADRSALAELIAPGDIYAQTLPGLWSLEFPAPIGVVNFIGSPVAASPNRAVAYDTLLRRLETIDTDTPGGHAITVELVELNYVSDQPVTVDLEDGMGPRLFDLYMRNSRKPHQRTIGFMNVRNEYEGLNGPAFATYLGALPAAGTFDIALDVFIDLELRPAGEQTIAATFPHESIFGESPFTLSFDPGLWASGGVYGDMLINEALGAMQVDAIGPASAGQAQPLAGSGMHQIVATTGAYELGSTEPADLDNIVVHVDQGPVVEAAAAYSFIGDAMAPKGESHATASQDSHFDVAGSFVRVHGEAAVLVQLNDPSNLAYIEAQAESNFLLRFTITEPTAYDARAFIHVIEETGATAICLVGPDGSIIEEYGSSTKQGALAFTGVLEPGVYALAGYAAAYTDAYEQPMTRSAESSLDLLFNLLALRPLQLTGDINLDGSTSIRDLSTLATYFGLAADATLVHGDINGDGAVTIADLSQLAVFFGQTATVVGSGASDSTSVPEPLSAAGIVLGALLLRRRMPNTALQ